MPAHPPLSTLANATVASSGKCHCHPEWHNFPVYIAKKRLRENNFACRISSLMLHLTLIIASVTNKLYLFIFAQEESASLCLRM